MKSATKEEFFDKLNSENRDVIVNSMGSFPYYSEFTYRHGGAAFGKITQEGEHHPRKQNYYLSLV